MLLYKNVKQCVPCKCIEHEYDASKARSICDVFLVCRNMMIESARFSHGQGMTQMNDLSKLDVNTFDAVIFPGGHGIVKNL